MKNEAKMMNKEIEKMASILVNDCTTPCHRCRYASDCAVLEDAIKLYKQSYRKQGEEK